MPRRDKLNGQDTSILSCPAEPIARSPSCGPVPEQLRDMRDGTELRTAYGKSSSSIDYGNHSISMLGLLHILIAIIYRKTTYQPMVSFRRAQSFVSRINNCDFIC